MTILADKITSGYDKKIIIDNQTIEISEGKINIIVGPNGCGKSTLFKSLCRQLHLFSGKVFLNAIDVQGITNKEFAKNVGILFQENQLPHDITVRELVSYGRFAQTGLFSSFSEKDENVIENAMAITNVKQFENKEVNSLSSGQRQLVWIAMLVAQEAKYLFLDEPTTYLDLKNQFEILNCLVKLNKEQNKTIIMILHDINIAVQYADIIFVMNDGKIITSGAVENVITEEMLKNIFDINVKIIKEDNKIYCIPHK